MAWLFFSFHFAGVSDIGFVGDEPLAHPSGGSLAPIPSTPASS
jgi:hypothetical protein